VRFKDGKHLTMRAFAPKLLLALGIVLLLPLGAFLVFGLLSGETNLAVVAPSAAMTFAGMTLAGLTAVGVGLVLMVGKRARRPADP